MTVQKTEEHGRQGSGVRFSDGLAVILRTTLHPYLHWQEYPLFSFHWRWKQYKQTWDFAIILFGVWFGIIIDYS